MSIERRRSSGYLMALLFVTTLSGAMAAEATEATEAAGLSAAAGDGLAAVTDSQDGLGGLRLFFAAEDRWQQDPTSGSMGSSAKTVTTDAAFNRLGETKIEADLNVDVKTSSLRKTSPVTTAIAFQAILQRGERVQLLFGGQLCRTGISRSNERLASEVRCSRQPPGARSLAFDARSSELVIESQAGRTRRLAVGESWSP